MKKLAQHLYLQFPIQIEYFHHLKVDINKYVHVELELEDGFAVMSECALHPVTGLWTSYIHSGFAKKIK